MQPLLHILLQGVAGRALGAGCQQCQAEHHQ